MSSFTPSIPKGTRDFGPLEMSRRNYIFSILRNVFEHYGYLPIETPAMENLSTLLGKYGDEGDRLLFRILNSGNFMENVNPNILAENPAQTSGLISEKGLRYDLTVPFARFVVQHRNEIHFPFKRYQIQPVWRADRPQKGRYREFYQCDADVIGSKSLMNEAELILLIDEIFHKLELSVAIKINNRKILQGVADITGHPNNITDLAVAIDKLEKIGWEKVAEELMLKSFTASEIAIVKPIVELNGSVSSKIQKLKELLSESPAGIEGVIEIEEIFNRISGLRIQSSLELDLSLARGLNYYTGAIFEVKSNEVSIGSICGGGRYDNLTGIFGLPGLSGVGISFGAERIYDVLLQLNKFPANATKQTEVLLINFGPTEEAFGFKLLQNLRSNGLYAELYPEFEKVKKQIAYADQRNIPYVLLIGENEILTGKFTLKNMSLGTQESLSEQEIISYFQQNRAV